MRKTNLKAVSAAKPEPMDWYLIDRLAGGVAQSLADNQQTLAALTLLFDEIAKHPDEAEGVANHANLHLFAWHTASDRAFDELMAAERARLA